MEVNNNKNAIHLQTGELKKLGDTCHAFAHLCPVGRAWSGTSRTWLILVLSDTHSWTSAAPWLLFSQLCIGNSSQYNAAAHSTSLRHSFLLAEKSPWGDTVDFPCRYGKRPVAQELLQQKLPCHLVCRLHPPASPCRYRQSHLLFSFCSWERVVSSEKEAVPVWAYFQMSSFRWCFGWHKCRQVLGPHLSRPSKCI